MTRTLFISAVALSSLLLLSYGQKKTKYKVIAIGSYNCENLFDLEDDPNKKDEDFTPAGPYNYTAKVYNEKLHNIATVIQKMGLDVTPDGPAIVGLVEIENGRVLKDLVAQPELARRDYQYIWFPTSDERGISTAMLYNPKYFQLLHAEPVRVPVETIGQTRPTRDVLFVSGILSGDTVHFLVNHWPSKSGGEAASAPGRRLAAEVDKHIIDSLQGKNPEAKIVLMGDLNDNPDADGVVNVLRAKASKDDIKVTDIYNPWMKMYAKGMGTEVFREEWNLIDQIMVSGALVRNNNKKWGYYNAEIFNRDFITNKMGKDKGHPHRSFTIAQVWDDGYSDHFPVLIYLLNK
ncbi:MAG: endonuclease/exonuclease/phosphatase family protein [Bacteroidota bacterium]